ncbi:MAG: SiaB family protein kinase [Campylobacterota bacterium]|nr:SiaB family protein kinase [Campylobacterota bacterium]
MLKHLNELKQSLDTEGVIFIFCGPMSHDIVVGLGNTLRMKLQEDEVSRTVSSKIFSIFVEQVQNVINYSEDKDSENHDMSLGIVTIGKKGDKFFISGGNNIANDKIKKLQRHLTQLQQMSQDELKQFYKLKRKETNSLDGKGGAGIGFIEMARKSSEPISFNFETIDSVKSFFTIKIIV